MTDKTDWEEIKKWAEKRLVELRLENDNNRDPVDTSNIRGKIALAKELLALENEDKKELQQVGNTIYLDG